MARAGQWPAGRLLGRYKGKRKRIEKKRGWIGKGQFFIGERDSGSV